ncbi:MAG: hypothetical protein GX141_02350 [Armatimonadetes bacterium]|nr:hypothetical protein [Armatimonadota bacterium]
MPGLIAGPGLAGKTCPYCQSRIAEGSNVTVCPACKTPHHSECWSYNGGCTTFGCQSGPGYEGPVVAQPHVDDDLGIVLYPEMGSDTSLEADVDHHYEYSNQQRQAELRDGRKNHSWLWATLSIIVFVGMLGALALTRNHESPALQYVEQAKIKYQEGDISGAIRQCTKAVEADPEYIAAYYLKGMLLIGKDSDNLFKLVERAKYGETQQLDEADKCFERCSKYEADNPDLIVEGLDITGSELIAEAHVYLAMTAVLRVAANVFSEHPDYAREWAAIARRNLIYARQTDLDPLHRDLATKLEHLLLEMRF